MRDLTAAMSLLKKIEASLIGNGMTAEDLGILAIAAAAGHATGTVVLWQLKPAPDDGAKSGRRGPSDVAALPARHPRRVHILFQV